MYQFFGSGPLRLTRAGNQYIRTRPNNGESDVLGQLGGRQSLKEWRLWGELNFGASNAKPRENAASMRSSQGDEIGHPTKIASQTER